MQNLHNVAESTYTFQDTLRSTALNLGNDLQSFSRSQLDDSPQDLKKKLREFYSLLDKLIEKGPEEEPQFEDSTMLGGAVDGGNDSTEGSLSFAGQLYEGTHSSPE